jgi:DNA repair ATPase RecN
MRIQFLDLPEEVQRMLEEDFEGRLAKELEGRKNSRKCMVQDEDLCTHVSGLEEKNVPPGEHLVNLNFREDNAVLSQPSVTQEVKPRGFLTPSHAEELLRIKDKPEAVKEVAQAIRDKGLTRDETSFVVNQIYRGIDPKRALKAAEEQMNKEFQEINEKYGHIFDGLIPSRRGIVHRLVELSATENFTEEEKKKIVELVNVKSLDNAIWEVKKLKEKPTGAVDLETEIAYLRKENETLKEKIAELEEQSRLREDLVVRCPFCRREFPIRKHVVA